MKRIKQIAVKGLFGTFDHVIPLNMEDRITIIHGLNGIGKTMILRLLNELFSQRYTELSKALFDEFRVDFDDESSFWVTKSHGSDSKPKKETLSTSKIDFCVNDRGVEKQPFTFPSHTKNARKLVSFSSIDLESIIPGLMRMSADEWLYRSTNEILSFEEILNRFSEILPVELSTVKSPDWLKEFRQSISIRFIEAQRLLSPVEYRPHERDAYIIRERREAMEPTITKYAEELATRIRKKIAESATLSQLLDKNFPQRVFEPTTAQKNMTEGELRKKLTEQGNKRSQLVDAGLLDQDNTAAFQMGEQIEESQRIMLSVYVEDMDKKLNIFDEISEKINLLTRIINKRFLYKEMKVSKADGFVFITNDGKIVPLDKLSSGEQNELVLFYNLLFKTKPGSLILIDEPELSLHVAWQIEFLEDLQDIISLTDIDMIITTHSPQIIHDRWDLTVTLEGPHR